MAESMPSQPDQVRRLFDAKAPTWSAKFARGGSFVDRLALFGTALDGHMSAGSRLLDLGCGTGELARCQAAADLLVTACDISAEMLRRAAEHDLDGAVEWVQLCPSWRTLPFETATFDAVTAASVLEYVADPGAVLDECCRVLRPGGIVLCTVPDLRHPVRWLEWLVSVGAGASLAAASARCWPRLDEHLCYIRLSRQRRSASWWCSVAAQAGLSPVPHPAGPQERSPLRLFTFQRPEDPRQD